jgi:hypothetical protein
MDGPFLRKTWVAPIFHPKFFFFHRNVSLHLTDKWECVGCVLYIARGRARWPSEDVVVGAGGGYEGMERRGRNDGGVCITYMRARGSARKGGDALHRVRPLLGQVGCKEKGKEEDENCRLLR